MSFKNPLIFPSFEFQQKAPYGWSVAHASRSEKNRKTVLMAQCGGVLRLLLAVVRRLPPLITRHRQAGRVAAASKPMADDYGL
jgi:hypothetical protein